MSIKEFIKNVTVKILTLVFNIISVFITISFLIVIHLLIFG